VPASFETLDGDTIRGAFQVLTLMKPRVSPRTQIRARVRLNGPFEGAEWLAEIFYSAAIPFEFRTLFEVTGARKPIRTI